MRRWFFDQDLYVFVATGNQHLAVNYWDGSSWHWADQGAPLGVLAWGDNPTAISYWVSTSKGILSGGYSAILSFIPANGVLYVNYWDGSRWNWGILGGV